MLAGCEGPSSVLAPLEAPSKLQAAEPRINGAIPSGRDRVPDFEARGAQTVPALAAPPPRGAAQAGDVTLNFVDTDIREIVRVVLGATLNANYTIDPSVQGTATLEVGKPLPRSELLPTLETLLNQNGATLTVRDGVYRVTPLSGAAAAAPIAGVDAVGSGSQIVPLRFAAAKDLAKVLEPYVTEGGKIAADSGRNALIVSGNPTVRQALVAMIRAFDIDVLAGQTYALFPAGDETAEKLAGELEKVFHSDAEGALAGVVRVVPMQRVNAVLVVSNQPRYIDAARRFFHLERRVEDATTRSWHVYYVQNGQSADLEAVLQRAFTPGHLSPTPAPPGGTAPGAPQGRLGGPGGTPGLSGLGQAGGGLGQAGGGLGQAAGGLGANGGAPGGLGSLSGAAPGGPEGANPAAEPLSPPGEGAADAENRMRIIANRRNNALLIFATPREYAVVEGMLRKIDIIPLQVLIDATIAEVTLNDALAYGTQFFLGNSGVAGTLSSAASGATPTINTVARIPIGAASNFPGFVFNNGTSEVLSALSAVTQLKVLSAPQVLVLDNEPARLQVGNIVPILTQSQQSTISANAPIVNSVDYTATGVILQVTPRVNSGGLVTLDISQEVSDVSSPTTGNINSPTFDQRLIRTRVAVQDGQTVGLAGLIRDSDSEGNQGIPVLKDIPLLGSLVSSQNNSRNRTELLVLITPRVVRDQRDARSLTEDLRNQLLNAGLVKQDLQSKPASGSPNPNRFP
jgi:general secretion pathway protein D